jgi:membrane protein
MLNRFILFLTTDLWNFRLDELTGMRKLGYRVLRIFSLSVAGFQKDLCTLRASSLTYYTLMSIVPILALAFSIARGFNLHEPLKEELLVKFPENREVLSEIIMYADRLVNETRGGLLAGIGFAVLIWSAISLIESMEAALNHIWEVEKMRSWRRIVGEYLALFLIAPILFVVSSSTVVIVGNYLEDLFKLFPLSSFFIALLHFGANLVAYAFFSFFFTFLYYFLPNTKVRASTAFLGGSLTGIFYLIAQWGYVYFQIGASRFGAIYGSLAALPLFLVWVQVSWFIFLFGAEVCCSFQTLDQHEFGTSFKNASPKLKKILSLWLLQVTVNRFQDAFTSMKQHAIIQQCRIPAAIAIPLLDGLVDCGLLAEIKTVETSYLPGRPIENLRISDALEALDAKGISDMPFICSKELVLFAKTLSSFDELIEKSHKNQLLSSLNQKMK